MVRDQYQAMGLVIPQKTYPTRPNVYSHSHVYSSLARSVNWSGNEKFYELKFLVTYHFLELSTSGKSALIPKENACEPDLSVVSFLPGLALMKTTVLESTRTLSYFRLDTLGIIKNEQSITVTSRKRTQYQISAHCFNFLQRFKVYSIKRPSN